MEPARQPPSPLTRPELERLWRWERGMIRYYAMAMTTIAILAALAVTYGESPWARRSALGVALVLVLAAAVVQFRERCRARFAPRHAVAPAVTGQVPQVWRGVRASAEAGQRARLGQAVMGNFAKRASARK